MDDPTEAQRIASQIIEAWHYELTAAGRAALSGNDLAALENMVAQAIAGDLDFLLSKEPPPMIGHSPDCLRGDCICGREDHDQN